MFPASEMGEVSKPSLAMGLTVLLIVHIHTHLHKNKVIMLIFPQALLVAILPSLIHGLLCGWQSRAWCIAITVTLLTLQHDIRSLMTRSCQPSQSKTSLNLRLAGYYLAMWTVGLLTAIP